MGKKILSVFLLLCLLTGCSLPAAVPTPYTLTFLDVFDTVTTVSGYAESSEAFREMANTIHEQLLQYHQLFDIYEAYPGVTNLKTVNDRAGTEPVAVDSRIFLLLQACKAYHEASGGKVNAAMGAVLRLWHNARQEGLRDPENAKLPDKEALQQAAKHTDMADLILNEKESTVSFADPALRLDVGAIAKGWAVQQVCKDAPAGLLINVGGNICATGPKTENGDPWIVGLQDPDGGSGYLHTIRITGGSVVTSGDYQRTYQVEGKAYHHIIDPATGYPAGLWRAVSVVCPDSGAADFLSTALFLLPQQEGQALLDDYGAEAMWVAPDGSLFYSPGFEAYILQ